MKTRFKKEEKENCCQIYNFLDKNSFLAENAMSWFETFGLYPLIRDKISEDTLAISAAFMQCVCENEDKDVPSVLATPKTPISKHIHRKPFESLENTIKKMNHWVELAIREHLRATTQLLKKKALSKITNSGLWRVITDTAIKIRFKQKIKEKKLYKKKTSQEKDKCLKEKKDGKKNKKLKRIN